MSGVPRITWMAQLLLFTVSAVAAFGGTGLAVRGIISTPLAVVSTPEATPTPTREPVVVLAPTPDPAPTATEPTAPPAEPITIAFGGDVHGEPPIANLLADGGNPFSGVQASLERADLAVVNLETALGTGGSPVDKEFTFQADAVLADRAAEAGIDIVNLANNHGLDYGRDAADETKEIAEAAGLATLGYGADADEAYGAHVVEVKGQTVAFIGLSRVLPNFGWEAGADRPGMASAYEVSQAASAVAAAAELADHVVVTIHWGQERSTCADGTQTELARAMVAAGADVIVGHHPHVLQGVVEIEDALVAYSLGNFVFYATRAEQRETGVLTVQLSPDGVDGYVWEPARISDGVPVPVDANSDIVDSSGAPESSDADDDSAEEDAGGTTGAPGADDGGASDPAPTVTAPEPSSEPTDEPSAAPTSPPSSGPSDAPSAGPSEAPSQAPAPSENPSQPSEPPAGEPTPQPTIPSPIQDPDPTDPPGATAETAESADDGARSVRRTTTPSSLPPLLQPSPSATGCASDLVDSAQ